MYLTQILEVDLDWLGENWEENATDDDFEDDEKCLDHFHRFQTIKLLQGVREEVGGDAFDLAFVHFDSVKNSGYTVEEIVSTGTDTLIDREEYIRYRMDDDESENENDDEEDDDDDDEDDAAMEEEEQMRRAVAASEASALEDGEFRMAIQESLERHANNSNVNKNREEEEEGKDDEDDILAAAVEEQHIRQAVASSEDSALEDEAMRIAMEESLARANDSSSGSSNNNDIGGDDGNKDTEEGGEDMLATAIEDQCMRQAAAASVGSALEDETLRIAIEESLE